MVQVHVGVDELTTHTLQVLEKLFVGGVREDHAMTLVVQVLRQVELFVPLEAVGKSGVALEAAVLVASHVREVELLLPENWVDLLGEKLEFLKLGQQSLLARLVVGRVINSRHDAQTVEFVHSAEGHHALEALLNVHALRP